MNKKNTLENLQPITKKNIHFPLGVQPWHLESGAKICEVFKCGTGTLKQMVKMGVPISVQGVGAGRRYSAEYNQLQAWQVENNY